MGVLWAQAFVQRATEVARYSIKNGSSNDEPLLFSRGGRLIDLGARGLDDGLVLGAFAGHELVKFCG